MSDLSPADDLSRALEEIRGGIHPAWTPERRNNAIAEGSRRARRREVVRRRVRTSALLAAVAALGVSVPLSASYFHLSSPVSPMSRAVPHSGTESLHLADGTMITPLDSHTDVRVALDSPDTLVVDLQRGGARFQVVHRNERVFRVVVGPVAVQVLGTTFTVERVDGAARVVVQDGRVRVFWGSEFADLTGGENGLFPRVSAESQSALLAAPTAEADPGAVAAAPQETATPHPSPSHGHAWRALAQEGDYVAAYRLLSHEGANAVRDETADLFLASDTARYGGHPEAALSPLRRIVANHRHDARAPLAAFTLGRVLLEDLGRPREAVDAFDQAGALDPSGSLAQDALARAVEAASRAGDSVRARERAEQYVREYPSGRRLRSVRHFGGLE